MGRASVRYDQAIRTTAIIRSTCLGCHPYEWMCSTLASRPSDFPDVIAVSVSDFPANRIRTLRNCNGFFHHRPFSRGTKEPSSLMESTRMAVNGESVLILDVDVLRAVVRVPKGRSNGPH